MKIAIGKIVGATFGLISGGLFGLIIGFIAGHLFDQFVEKNIQNLNGIDGDEKGGGSGFDNASLQVKIQQIFFRTTFRVMGRIAKADGVVSTEEIAAAQNVMSQMGLNDDMRQQAIVFFTEGKDQNFDLNQDIRELKQALRHQPSLSQMFLEIQLSIAYSDGVLAQEERKVFDYVCRELGISVLQFELIHARVRAAMSGGRDWSSRRNSGSNHQQQSSSLDIANAYAVLGVKPEISDKDLKKEYRKLISQHHPDKLVSKGLPPEMMKLAKEKTQEIQNAYDQIQKKRKG
jgi:DnaJ like chaperone protein